MNLRAIKTLLPAATFALSASVAAQGIEVTATEISRGAADIRAVMVPRPDMDATDTALVFTNPGRAPSVVVCAGRDSNGVGVGRAKTEVPPHGVRLILASDLSRGGDFVGSATCKARNRVIPSSFIVGPGLSDGPVRLHHGWDSTEMNFPIVATF